MPFWYSKMSNRADRRVAVAGEFEGAGDADIVDLLTGVDGLQRIGQIRQVVFRRARLSSRLEHDP